MRYYSVAYQDEHSNDVVETLSEDSIHKQYYEYWYSQMCKKYGKELVERFESWLRNCSRILVNFF